MNIIFIQIIILLNILIVELKENNNKFGISTEIIEILEINDSNFDSIIQNGNKNRWLILFYLKTCHYCYNARRLLNKIIELKKYKEINNIKFASIETKKNTKTNIRFNITKVPYIILVENNTMLELDSYSNEKNLINFIETNFTNAINELKPFPAKNIFKYHYRLFINSLNYLVDAINDYLESKNINFELNLLTFVLSYIFICFALWISIIYIYFKCFNSKRNKINIKKSNHEKTMENNSDNSINEETNNKINNINKKDFYNEEEKKIKEEIKEKEFKDKDNNLENKNIITQEINKSKNKKE